jgi:uncharacterized membrane protein HdeD (DUF308 family)
MINPYQTPTFDPRQFQDQPGFGNAAANLSWVSQVRTFAILNIIQGALEIPMGLMFSGMAVLFPVMMSMEQARDPSAGEELPFDGRMYWLVSGIYLVIGIPVLTSGILRIVAGVRNFRFKGRTLSLISIIAGASSVLSCYCAPTALGILVYGLIIHLNPAVKAAFEMGRQGRTAEQILAAFSLYQPSYYGMPPPSSAVNPPSAGENPFS